MNQLINRFQIVQNLHVDKNQKVFIADDFVLERSNVVVRVFRRGLFSSDRDLPYRFFSWHQGIDHPHLARILDAGISEANEIFYVREYIQSPQELFSGNVPWIKPLLATIRFLHEQGRVHGALKPSNLFIQNGKLIIADPRLFPAGDLNSEDIRYTAPESLAGSASTFATDIYSVGALLYRALSGRDPFDDFDLANLKAKYMWGSPRPLIDICHVSKTTSDVVGRLLDHNADKRVSAFKNALLTLDVMPVGAKRTACVGRDLPIRAIQLTNEKKSRSGLKVFVVVGVPGIGKTRFIEELRLRANFSPADFETICCKKEMDFGIVVRGIRRLLKLRSLKKRSTSDHELGNFAPTLSRMLLDEKEDTHANQFPLERTISDLVGFVAGLAQRKPLILAIENVEYADDITRRFIETLCLRAAEIPALLILTTSVVNGACLSKVAVDSLHDSLEQIHLGELPAEEARNLIGFFACSAKQAAHVLKWAGGHPLLIEECARTVHLSSKLTRNINSIVDRLLVNLTKDSRSVAELISLFEKPIPTDLIAEINDKRNINLSDCLQMLCSAGIAHQQEASISIKWECVRTKLVSCVSRQRKTRLNALAYTSLKNRTTDSEVLATCAFKAELFEAALTLFQDLARNAYENGDFSRASKLFEMTGKCGHKIRQRMPNLDRFKLARCYDRVGKQAHARRIYETLLSEATTEADPVLISSICAEISGPYQTRRKWNRIRLCTDAIGLLPKDSPELVQAYLQLKIALLRKGELKLAGEALNNADAINSRCQNPKDLRSAWAYLHIHQGDFKSALKYMDAAIPSPNQSPKLLTNIACCLEQLGLLESAKETQTTALNLATTTGYVAIQVVSLGNLACIESKLGHLLEANRLFTLAFETLDGLVARDREFSAQIYSTLLADAARHSIQLNDYKTASRYLKKISRDVDARYQFDNVYIDLVRCELALSLGNMAKARKILHTVSETPIAKIDFFKIERLMLEARFDSSIPHKVDALKQAVELSEKLGTLHHYCRALNEMSDVLIKSGQVAEAQQLLVKSAEIARVNGYRPLFARIILLRALAAPTTEEKFADLFTAFYMASEIGLSSLAAEIAFWIGTFQLEVGNCIAAQEYLKRSILLVDSIVEQLPHSWRRDYIAKSFRARANTALGNLIKMNPASLGKPQIEHSEADNAFKAIYRLATSVAHAAHLETLLESLVNTFQNVLSRPIILIVDTPNGRVWRSLRMKLSDELVARVTSLNQKIGDKTYFGSGGSTHTKDTVAWIPLAAGDYRGGIYVTCPPGEPPFSEREMEFLTVVGVIANRTLDQLVNRRSEQVHAPRIQEFHGIIGGSKAILEVYSHIEIAAGNTATVLIEGESGTGKELVAKAIHQRSGRAKGPFVAVDCGAIPDTLIEAELFGAKRGAYTDAVADRPGLFEVADRGTIFLDEIGNTTPAVQAKLLRVLQEREVRRIGEAKARTVDVRLIAATNANLDALSKEGRFRKDLLYRLKVLHITVPPLRQRRDDIPMLAHAFLEKLNLANRAKKTFAPGVTAELLTHPFPGNVRELQNAVERAFFVTKGTTINRIALETEGSPALSNDVQSWFKEIVAGRKNFWSHVHDRYKKRDIPREKVIALVDLGLKSTRGSYKNMASMLNLKGPEYRRFMDFLRRNDCLLDFRPYRQAAAGLS